MGRNVEAQTETVNPKEFERMERKLEEITTRLGQVRNRITQLEDQTVQLESELRAARQQKNKLNIEIQSCKSQEPMLVEQIRNQKVKYQEAELDQKKLGNLSKAVTDSQKEYEKAKEESDVIEKQVNKLHAEIIAKTKGRLEAAQKKLDDATDKLDKVKKEKTRLRVAITTAERNVKKCEERIENMKQEIEECVERIKKSAAEIKEIEEKGTKTLEEFEDCERRLQELQEENSDIKGEMDGLLEEENKLKAREIDLKQELSKAKGELEQRHHKIVADKKRMESLKLIEEPMNEEKVELKELTQEELDGINIDDIMEEIKNKENSLPKQRPNLGAIQEYTKKQQVCLEREKELEDATNNRNKTRSVLEEFRKTRLTEFMKGFSVISMKVKECYQMLAEGGDAELELVNTMDPFLDGIRYVKIDEIPIWIKILAKFLKIKLFMFSDLL